MREATPKERMLKSIRRALIEKTENPYPRIDEQSTVFKYSDEEMLEIVFAEEFAKRFGENHQVSICYGHHVRYE